MQHLERCIPGFCDFSRDNKASIVTLILTKGKNIHKLEQISPEVGYNSQDKDSRALAFESLSDKGKKNLILHAANLTGKPLQRLKKKLDEGQFGVFHEQNKLQKVVPPLPKIGLTRLLTLKSILDWDIPFFLELMIHVPAGTFSVVNL